MRKGDAYIYIGWEKRKGGGKRRGENRSIIYIDIIGEEMDERRFYSRDFLARFRDALD